MKQLLKLLNAFNIKPLYKIGTVTVLLTLSIVWLTACKPDKVSPSSTTTTKKNCEKNHTGNWCIKNETQETYDIMIDPDSADRTLMKLPSGENGIFLGLKIGDHKLEYSPEPLSMNPSSKQIKVIECATDTTIIK